MACFTTTPVGDSRSWSAREPGRDSDPRSHRLRAAAERGAAGADARGGDEIAPATRKPEFAFI